MSNSNNQPSKPIYKIVLFQTLLVLLFAVAVAAFQDLHKGFSAGLGGAIAVIGSLIYAMLVADKTGDPTTVMKAHFRAEMVKIFITAVLFLLVLLLFHSVAALWLILGFAVVTLSYWFALFVV